jgi:hypothetical protein
MTTPPIQTLTDELLGEIEFDAECHGSGATVAHTLIMLEEICTLRAENAELRKALDETVRQIEGNIKPTVRDCINGMKDHNDIYGYCDAIIDAISTAMEQAK